MDVVDFNYIILFTHVIDAVLFGDSLCDFGKFSDFGESLFTELRLVVDFTLKLVVVDVLLLTFELVVVVVVVLLGGGYSYEHVDQNVLQILFEYILNKVK